jgi:solute carrier family 25 S-adenosylmethionine transporter 26
VITGSAPAAAIFFVTYESTKSALARRHPDIQSQVNTGGAVEAVDHMIAASLGEIAACAVRVPTEVVKQRAQASQFPSSWESFQHIFRTNRSLGRLWMELYRGWSITVMREIPFTIIQFPLWEAMKRLRGKRKNGSVNAAESALFGSVAGSVAAAATTPLDVLKTRLMLAKQVAYSTLCLIVSCLPYYVSEEASRVNCGRLYRNKQFSQRSAIL